MQRLLVVTKSLFMALCAIAIFGFITRRLQAFDALLPFALPAWSSAFGVVLMAAGAILLFFCFGLFAAAGALTPGPTFPDPPVFISRGPYRLVRNPMSKGGFTVLAGWGFYRGSPTVVLFAFLMLGLMHLFVVHVEEPKLEARFGASYREYVERVGRWLPRFGSLV